MWIEIVGIAGMIVLLLTFYLASNHYLNDRNYFYHLLNILGAISVMINAFSKGVLAVGFVEVVWSIIGLLGIANVYRCSKEIE